jgi:hypothetical protein
MIKCPNCGSKNNSKKDGGNENCFHCGDCWYVECEQDFNERSKMEKIKEMISSVSFWYAVILSVAFLLDQLGTVPGAYAKAIELFAAIGITRKGIDGFRK